MSKSHHVAVVTITITSTDFETVQQCLSALLSSFVNIILPLLPMSTFVHQAAIFSLHFCIVSWQCHSSSSGTDDGLSVKENRTGILRAPNWDSDDVTMNRIDRTELVNSKMTTKNFDSRHMQFVPDSSCAFHCISGLSMVQCQDFFVFHTWFSYVLFFHVTPAQPWSLVPMTPMFDSVMVPP